MHRTRLMILAAALFIAAPALFALSTAHAAMSPVTVQLTAENNSGETGTATLTDGGNGKTVVEVKIDGEPDGASQPMHIHSGQCGPTLGKVVYPLTNVEKGASSTTIDAALDTLTTGGFAINGHKSAQEIQTYVFCGNIPSEAMMMGNETGTPAAMMDHGTATPDAMMAQGTATPEAMMAQETATPEAMMAQGTATPDAMMAQETATPEAMMAQGTATPEAMMAQGTATPTAGAPATLPTSGGSSNALEIVFIGGLGLAALGAGLTLRHRATRR